MNYKNILNLKFWLQLCAICVIAALAYGLHPMATFVVLAATVMIWKLKYSELLFGTAALFSAVAAIIMLVIEVNSQEQLLLAVTFVFLLGCVISLWISGSYKEEPYHSRLKEVEAISIFKNNVFSKIKLRRLSSVPSSVVNVGLVSGYIFTFSGNVVTNPVRDFVVLGLIIIFVNFISWRKNLTYRRLENRRKRVLASN